MMNDANTHCNTWDNAQDTLIGIFAGIALLGVNLAYVCFWKKKVKDDQSFIRVVAGKILAKEIEDEMIYDDEQPGRNMLFFHLYMALVSIYMSMILTNWGSANITNDIKKTYQNDYGTLWIKFIALWISVGMYLASMILPKFKRRGFRGWTQLKEEREMT